MNNQPPEKKVRGFTGTYDVHSVFYTIQGEGPFAGTPAVFIRLAGCNLQCPACDTEYTAKGREFLDPMTTGDILAAISEARCGQGSKRALVVITGGEPFRQDLSLLVDDLLDEDFYVQIETNGTLPLNIPPRSTNLNPSQREGCYIVVSPKTGKVHPSIWDYACCVKYVGNHEELSELDGLPEQALKNALGNGIILARPPRGWDRPIYLQPMDWTGALPDIYDEGHEETLESLNRIALATCLESCYKYGYILQLQVHKILGVP